MTYTVQPGDTLNGIALKLLGSAEQAPTLFAINKSRIKSQSPETLTPGEQIIIPDQMITAAAVAKRNVPRGSTEVALIVRGIEYVGWQTVEITRSLETASASWSVELTDKWTPASERWPIYDYDLVQVWIGPDLIVDGYVDDVEISIDGGTRSMRVSGRDKTADLIDCSAMNRPGVFKGKKVEDIAQRLAQPFGIKVVTDVDTGDPIASFALLPGEKVHEAVARAAIAKNLIVVSSFRGDLAITRSGDRKATDAIVEGINLEGGDSKASSAERFSDYTVEGQASGQGGKKNGMKATYHDAGVPRYRPLMIPAEQKASAEYLKGRAEWEARARAAKARNANVKLVGWRQSDSLLWQTNRIVFVDSPSLGIEKEDLLISSVTFSMSDGNGQTVSLKLVRPDAYTSAVELQAEKDMGRLERRNRRGRKKKGQISAADLHEALKDSAQYLPGRNDY